MKHFVFLIALITLCGSSFAAPKCDTLVPIAESAYRAIDDARKAQDWTAARSWAEVFWQIQGSADCAVSKALGEALVNVKLGPSNMAQDCPDVRTTSGNITYRKVLDTSNRTTLAPDVVTVNGVRYKIVTATGPEVSYNPKDIAKLLSDPAKKDLRAQGIDPELLKKWQRFEK
jgi:hypothetical protein